MDVNRHWVWGVVAPGPNANASAKPSAKPRSRIFFLCIETRLYIVLISLFFQRVPRSTPAVILNKWKHQCNYQCGPDGILKGDLILVTEMRETSPYVAQYYVFSIVAYENIFKINVRQVQPTPWMIPPKPYNFATWRLWITKNSGCVLFIPFGWV